jgi:hypothetical protein
MVHPTGLLEIIKILLFSKDKWESREIKYKVISPG